ncbi:MAG: hypothetical protein CMP47_00320 [Rickettsiales bacterium]|jgi:type I restriction enzyme S subunit|nr:hypothetical protein [Rickettsiales bacterium]
MVPNGWKTEKLASICTKITDGAHHSPKSVPSGYPMFSVKDMTHSGFRSESARHISEADFKALERQNCKPLLNDILIAKDGSILKYCFVVEEEIDGVILSSIALLRPNLNIVEPKFISHYFSQDWVKFYVGKALTSGSGVPRIILKDFKSIKIPLPPLPEQRKIAKILSTWDKAITTTERLIDNSKQQKKALMQLLLTGKRRFSGFTKDWKQIHLGDIGKCITGLTYKPSDTVDDGMLVLRSSNIQDSKLAFEDNVFVNADLKVKSKTQENDILVCVRNGSKNLIGKSTLIKGRAIGQAHGAFMTLFRSKYPLYVSQLFQSDEFFRQVNMNLGATINSINTSDLHKFKFSIPTDENEINAIAACLSNAEKEIEVLQQQLVDLNQEKKALMQQLLTGKRRVKI